MIGTSKQPRQPKSFACSHCGAAYGQFQPQCRCGKWDTIRRHQVGAQSALRRLDQGAKQHRRRSTAIPKVDYVLGGGMVLGSSIFLTGDPGAGKSTLALQIGYWTATEARRHVLYIGGEENQDQVCERARRIGINPAWFWFHNEVDLAAIERQLVLAKPCMVIVDSVQLIGGGLDEDPVRFFREYKQLLKLLQRVGVPGLLISQMNGDGKPMGGNRVSHMCDVVLKLDHDRQLSAKSKNRFGKTPVFSQFVMTGEGLQ